MLNKPVPAWQQAETSLPLCCSPWMGLETLCRWG